MSLWSYCYLCAEMADLASRHNNSRRFFPSLPRHFSIVQTTVCSIIAIYAQKTTATDRYWCSFGPAKFDAATAGFEAETRRAISSSISVCFLQIMHINISNNIMYSSIPPERWYNIIIMSITTKRDGCHCHRLSSEHLSLLLVLCAVCRLSSPQEWVLAIFCEKIPWTKFQEKWSHLGWLLEPRGIARFCALNDLCTPKKEAETLDSLSRRVYEKPRRSPVKLD